MSTKEMMLFAWMLVVVGLTFFFSHFLSCLMYAVQKGVALGLLPVLVFTKVAAGIGGVHLLP